MIRFFSSRPVGVVPVFRGLVLFALFLSPSGLAAFGQRPLTSRQRLLNIESFEYIWRTVKERHWDPALNGVDWAAARVEYLPRVKSAKSMAEAREAMVSLLSRLGQSHVGIIPSEAYEMLEGKGSRRASAVPRGARTATPGLAVQVVDGDVLVTRVDPDSSAAKAGVRPGWRLARIGDEDLAPLLAHINDAYANAPLEPFLLTQTVSSRLQGAAGEEIALEFSHDGKRIPLVLTRTQPPGTLARLGHLPPMRVYLEARRLSGDIGYMRLTVFFDPLYVLGAFEEALRDFSDTAGLIIDLRGNPGGIGGMAMGMAGWLIDQPEARLGTMRTRDAVFHFAVFPRAKTYSGRVAVLIDGSSASTAEILAAGLRDLGRARLFGTRTAGLALPSVVERLPNGDRFQFPIAEYESAAGVRIEGVGIEPDEFVPLTRAALLAERDPVLEAAQQWIRSSAAPRSATTGYRLSAEPHPQENLP